MARLGSINNNNRRKELSVIYAKKRQALKDIIMDRSLPLAQRFAASVKLSELPRNSAPIRFRRRCAATGRPRGVYRFCGLGRIALREMAVQGLMPGMRRSSW